MFKSPVWAGFECATGVNVHGEWIDQVAATEHDRFLDEDYARVAALGVRTVRDGVRWPLVDRGGRMDLSTLVAVVEAARRRGLEVVYDLFHFGYPHDVDLFSAAFPERFEEYCYAVARYVASHSDEPFAFTPVNEPSYFSWAAGEVGLFAPHARGRGSELKVNLARAAIRGAEAVWAACPDARIVNADPICRVVAPAGRPECDDEVRAFNESVVFESYDLIAGRLMPELGGSRRHLGVAGVNFYWTNQWEHGQPGVPLAADDPRRCSLGEVVRSVWDRYGVEVAVTETSHVDDARAAWIRRAANEITALLDDGVPVRGLCVYPVLGMPEWHARDVWTRMGVWDLEPRDGALVRVAHAPFAAALAKASARLASHDALRTPAAYAAVTGDD